MKRFAYLLLALVIAIYSCSTDSKPVVEELFPTMIQPFAVEHYEIIAAPSDTTILLHLNRNLKKDEFVALQIDIEHEGQYGQNIYRFQQQHIGNKILRINFPNQDTSDVVISSNNASSGKFSELIRNKIKQDHFFDRFDVLFSPGNFGRENFRDGQLIYSINNALNFNAAKLEDTLYDRSVWTNLNSQSLFKNYDGALDKLGQKQGKWKWHYSKGNLMATAEFEDDSLISPFKFYYYTGELLDSCNFVYINGKAFKSQQRYYRNGQLQFDRGYKYRIEYNPDGEVTSYSDTRNCDSCDISKLDEIKFTTLDGRNYLIIDSLETIQLSENIRPFLNCINRCEYIGGLDFVTVPTSWEAHTPIQVKATLPGVLFLDIDISVNDTTVRRTIDFTVEGVRE